VNADEEADFRGYAASRMRGLRRTAFLLCGDWHHAEDVTQNVLTKLYRTWPRISDRERVDAYAHTMLVRATFDRRRRASWRRELSAAVVPDTASAGQPNVEERMVLLDALAKMPPRQRAAVVLRYWADLDVAETAQALNCSQGTVKSQTARGLVALRELLADSQLIEGRTP
jgi:RNA polymerase sigma-70 factor (sigma-E family)